MIGGRGPESPARPSSTTPNCSAMTTYVCRWVTMGPSRLELTGDDRRRTREGGNQSGVGEAAPMRTYTLETGVYDLPSINTLRIALICLFFTTSASRSHHPHNHLTSLLTSNIHIQTTLNPRPRHLSPQLAPGIQSKVHSYPVSLFIIMVSCFKCILACMGLRLIVGLVQNRQPCVSMMPISWPANAGNGAISNSTARRNIELVRRAA
jgi:hypothetical protein